MIVVFKPGQKIKIADGAIEGTIISVTIYAHGGALYEVSWWNNGDREIQMLSEQEFAEKNSRKAMAETIGFKPIGGEESLG